MKTDSTIVKKYLALLLLMTYLFISSSYIFFLPRYNIHIVANNSNGKTVASTINFHRPHFGKGVANSYVVFHRIYKSVTENKRHSAILLLAAATFFISIILSGADLAVSLKITGNRRRIFPVPHRSSYLTFCTLRI